ncbi:YfhO family protein [Flavobacterium litorale]|uniref:YfhO family protein n=1 Tax=Flavobacterium litorale TaxID=2856519 RepID=A0ABX8V5R1_9FLAO|nr:YfhO family protein [Flavobacterium litorale]QYJ67832.1 YfhO family protein [Flavobacterium litorale]
MKNINKLYPHLLALLGFVLISLIYFYPVLQGKKIYQSDIVQYTGMAKEQNDFRAATDEEPYWTNSAFGGMPTYQLGAKYPHNYIKELDYKLRFLPRPADYLFLYFIGFYILMCVLKVDPLKAFFGALAFGFSTYLIIILGVGHNAKAHAIAYMPMVVAGVLLVFKKRYITGGLLTIFATALEINANHFQMTYYLLLLLLVIGIYYLIQIIKQKDFKHLGLLSGTFIVAVLLAVGANATSLMATAEYTDFSIRGKSELTINADGSENTTDSAMDYDYITEYSYGIAESFNLIAPRLFGGGSSENVGADSEMYEFILEQGATPQEAQSFVAAVPTYWGDQPIVEAPAYVGAVVFFLAILCIFIDKRKVKYAFLAGAILSLLLSWGKNFPALTTFFIDNVPLYDKFRAVSSIQVILELCFPVLAIMGLQSFFKATKQEQWKALQLSAGVALGLVICLFLFKGSFNFTGAMDARLMEMYGSIGPAFVEALQEQRESMYVSDLLRSGILILLVAAILWAFKENKLKATVATIVVGLLMVGDLYFVDRNYVNKEDFVNARKMDKPFQATPTDNYILQDTSFYRVYEPQLRLQGRTSYFHNSVGGYSAVRPRRMDQLFTYIADNQIQDMLQTINREEMALGERFPVLNLLNIKYIILQAGEGQSVPITNPYANGAAWFVNNIQKVTTPDDEITGLIDLDTKKTAIVNANDLTIKLQKNIFATDNSTATITLKKHEPNYIKYTSNNKNGGLAVFSEMYYANGWNAYVNGTLTPHFRANYVLRAMQLPAGKHTIEFKFEPQVVKTGGTITLISFILIVILLIIGIYITTKQTKQLK